DGGPGDDTWLAGGEGNDIIVGGPGCNDISGGPGENQISGAANCDYEDEDEEEGDEEEVCQDEFMFTHIEPQYRDGKVTSISFEWTTYDSDWYRLIIVSPTGAVKEILLLGDLGILLPVGELVDANGQIGLGQYAAIVIAQEEGGWGGNFTDVCRSNPGYFQVNSIAD
ncbi:MAG: hypothetical protein JXB47_18765, partial [Anaerolineae bacterium]|nr:hypothetical protein [Anaerolineae bacterium]